MLARPRGRPGHVEDVVEELEGEADAAAKGAEGAGVAAGLERTEAARRLEQPRGLELAAREVALDRHGGVPGVGALAQLALGERAARVGEDADLVDPAVLGELGERAGEQEVTGRGRRAAPRARDDGRHAPAQRGGVEHVVVDERRAVDELDGGRRADEPLAVRLVGREEHEQRSQALAARGDRRARVLGERHAVADRELARGASSTRTSSPGTWSPAARMTSVTGPLTAMLRPSSRRGWR